MLFATNNNMAINTNNNTATNNISLSLNQTNFSTGLNNQNNQNNMNVLSTGANMNNMNNQINFSTSTQPSVPQVDISQINMNDYNSMQMLFQTNSMGMNMGLSQPMTLNSTNTNMNTS
jgi:hypothetical protein